MKKNIRSNAYYCILISCLIFSIVSCKKNPESPTTNSSSHYVRFKADGIQKEYTLTWAKLNQLLYGNTFTSYVTGGTLSDTTKNSLSFRIYHDNSVTQNFVYSEKMYSPLGMPEAYFVYADVNGDLYTSFENALNSALEFKIHFTEITPSYVKGIFNGKTKSLSSNQIKIITDGEFYVVRR